MSKIIATERLRDKNVPVPYYGNLEFWFIWKLFPLSVEYILPTGNGLMKIS